MTFKGTAEYLLPPIVVDAARWLLTGQHTMHETNNISIHYEMAHGWTTPQLGTVDFDFDVMKRPASSELDLPIVRDNLEALARIRPPGAKLKLLDFGSGNGHYKLILSANSHTSEWQYVGVDTMPEAIEFCHHNYPGTLFKLVEDARPLPFDDDEFDVVLASGVIQYIQDPATVLVELQRVTREYVLVSRLPSWKYRESAVVVQSIRGAEGEILTPLHVFNRKLLEDIFQTVGFVVAFRDFGSEYFSIAGVPESVTHSLYLLKKTSPHGWGPILTTPHLVHCAESSTVNDRPVTTPFAMRRIQGSTCSARSARSETIR